MQLAMCFLFDGDVSPGISIRRGVCSVVRKTYPSLKASAMRDFEDILMQMGLYGKVHHSKMDSTYSYQGRMVEFFSVDDAQKVRSRKRDILIIVEANELKFREEFIPMLLRTKYRTYMDFNPDQEDIWIRTELEERRVAEKGDVEVIVSTWRDNIANLTDDQIEEILYLEKVDSALYQIFGEGQYATIHGHIFKNWSFGKYPEDRKNEYLGVDFGFHPHPCAIVKVARDGNTIYLKQVAYQTGWTNSDLNEYLKIQNLNRMALVADSAEPKSIEELRRYGLVVSEAKKGPDSIRQGIGFMQKFDIVVDPDSTNLVKELRNYVWSEAKDSTPISGAGDHLIDAVRYVVQTKYKITRKLRFIGSA